MPKLARNDPKHSNKQVYIASAAKKFLVCFKVSINSKPVYGKGNNQNVIEYKLKLKTKLTNTRVIMLTEALDVTSKCFFEQVRLNCSFEKIITSNCSYFRE